MGSKKPREKVAGPESGPEAPFAIKLSGPVIKGFGRGSRELGIPTANIPPSGLSAYPDLVSGVYYGFVGLRLHPDTTQPADNSRLTLSSSSYTAAAAEDSSKGQPMPQNANARTTLNDEEPPLPAEEREGGFGVRGKEGESTKVYPAVLSIGFNPYYGNETRSIEIHILHPFPRFNFYHSPLNLLILGFIRQEENYDSLDALVEDIKTDCDVARASLDRIAYQKYKAEQWLKEFEWVDSVDVEKIERETVGDGEPKNAGDGNVIGEKGGEKGGEDGG